MLVKLALAPLASPSSVVNSLMLFLPIEWCPLYPFPRCGTCSCLFLSFVSRLHQPLPHTQPFCFPSLLASCDQLDLLTSAGCYFCLVVFPQHLSSRPCCTRSHASCSAPFLLFTSAELPIIRSFGHLSSVVFRKRLMAPTKTCDNITVGVESEDEKPYKTTRTCLLKYCLFSVGGHPRFG